MKSAENYDVASMDREHSGQLNLFNDLKAAIRGGAPDSLVYVLLDQLVEHTNVHFLSEQLAMKLHAYEAYEAHLLEHQRLLAELKGLKQNLAEGKPGDKHSLIEALRAWMIAHIETTDKAFAEYLSTQAVQRS
jgi:hemerythrin-like metal-binding protein